MGGAGKNDQKFTSLVQVPQETMAYVPMVSLYNDRVRPLLDTIDKLRLLMVTKEGIQLPTIVVVGDQSSGKSSVLESLAGINLPRGQGICTRVPLIMRLQNHASPQLELSLEFNGKVVRSDEAHIASAISHATDEIAGNSKGISSTPLTLVVKKSGAPDLTMVDLPGITRVPVHGQPENIYEQITNIIMEYIRPEESIILNVLSATVDFPTCESIRMSQKVDKNGKRTLAVVTKADKAPEGLLEKVTADDVNIGLGYVCVRNRVGDESYEEARMEEASLFQTHPLLSNIDKSIVGVPVLAQKLVNIQAASIARNLPEIVKKINEKLNANMLELNKLPRTMSSAAEAMATLVRIIGLTKESLRKVLLRGEYDEWPEEDSHMHCTTRLVEMLNQLSCDLQEGSNGDKKGFLVDEIMVLEESKGIGLPNFLPRQAFLAILQNKVDEISGLPVGFVMKAWSYVEGVVVNVMMRHSEHFPQLQLALKRAGHNLMAKMKDLSACRAMEIVQMEKLTDYTCSPDYTTEWNKLMVQQQSFVYNVTVNGVDFLDVDGFGMLQNLSQLKQHHHVLSQAFDLKMRMSAYWKIVLLRLVDCMALHLKFTLHNLVERDIELEIVNEIMGPRGSGIEKMLGDSPAVSEKRQKLNRSIKLLKASEEVVAQVMDQIAAFE